MRVLRGSSAGSGHISHCLGRYTHRGVALSTIRTTPGTHRSRTARRCSRTVALINVDVSPALILGVGMMGSGLALYTVRSNRPEISRDSDVFFSSVAILVGGILIFQGWRLDPLLLFGQLLTSGTALAFAMEVLKLRQAKLEEMKALPEDRATQQYNNYEQDGESPWIDRLPPPDERRRYPHRDAESSSFSQQPDQAARQWQQPQWEYQQSYTQRQSYEDDEDRRYSSAPRPSSEGNDTYFERGSPSSSRDPPPGQQQSRGESESKANRRGSNDDRPTRPTWGEIDDVEDW